MSRYINPYTDCLPLSDRSTSLRSRLACGIITPHVKVHFRYRWSRQFARQPGFDLNLGHYERFTNSVLTWNSSWTTGQIYQRVFERERQGEYQGNAMQVIPHVRMY